MSKDALKTVIWGGILLLPFIPFLVSSSTLFPFIVGKNLAFRLITAIVFGAWALLALEDSSYRPKKSAILWLGGAFVLSIGVSTLLSPNILKSFWSNFERMEGFVTVLFLGVLFLAMSSFMQKASDWARFFAVNVWASVAVCIYAISELEGPISEGGRLAGSFGNAIYLAVYLMFAFFFALYLLAHTSHKWKRFMYGGVMLLQFVIIYYTATRGVMLGLLVGLLVSSFVLMVRGTAKTRRLAAALGVAILLAGAGFVAIRDTAFVRESPVLARFASLSPSEIKSQGRYFIWPMAIKGVAEKPLLGWGPESFNYVFNTHYDSRAYDHEAWFDRAHNLFLEWFVAGGIIGGTLFLALCLASLWKAFRMHEAESKDEPKLSGVSSAIVVGALSGYFFQGLFVFDNIMASVLFVSLLAFVHSFAGQPMEKLDKWKPSASLRRVLSAALIIVLVFTSYFSVWKPLRAGQMLIDGMKAGQLGAHAEALNSFEKALGKSAVARAEVREQLVASHAIFSGADGETRERYRSLVRRELEAQIAKTPDDARYVILYAFFLRNAGLNDEALDLLARARELTPGKQAVLFEMAQINLSMGRNAEAVSAAREALELEPSYDEAKSVLGLVEYYAGDRAAAERVWSTRAEEKHANDDRVIEAYRSGGEWGKIINLLQKRVEIWPDEIASHASLAAGYLEAGRRADAIAVMRIVAERFPEHRQSALQYIDNM